jgi:hypothetical protein
MQLTDKQLDNFWAKVDVHLEDECWWWTAGRDACGYGKFRLRRTSGMAHRVMYELMVGPIPSGLEIDHLCHQRACVNLAHMRVCRHADNVKNRLTDCDSQSGLKGIRQKLGTMKWQARVMVDKSSICLGCFDTKELAHAAYCVAAVKYHKEFHNTGHGVQTDTEASN